MRTVVTQIPVYDPQTRAHMFVDVDVEVNVDSLARQLVRRAIHSRSRHATIASGAVTVTIRTVEEVK